MNEEREGEREMSTGDAVFSSGRSCGGATRVLLHIAARDTCSGILSYSGVVVT